MSTTKETIMMLFKNLTIVQAMHILQQIKSLFIDAEEVFLFAVTVSLIILVFVLLYYSSIQKEVSKTSRCLRGKQNNQTGDVYTVKAHNEYNDPLYQVSYDLAAKKYDISCLCKPGDTVNHFTDIKVYDMRNHRDPIQKIDDHICQCDRNIEPVTTYYDGYPDLIRFMNTSDTKLFTNS